MCGRVCPVFIDSLRLASFVSRWRVSACLCAWPIRCLNNKKDPRSMRDPVGLLKEYMFYLCLEPYELYLSDKLYRGFQAGAIPVFLGHPEVGDFIPHPDAVIHVSDFDSPKALASYLKSVAQSPDLWFKHTKWRNSPGEITEKFVRAARFGRCLWRLGVKPNRNTSQHNTRVGFGNFSSISCALTGRIQT